MVRLQSPEHKKAVDELAIQYNGTSTFYEGLKKGVSCPDVRCKDFDIEVESLTKGSIKEKLHRYDKNRKRKMFIIIPSYLKEYFQEFEIYPT
jgi:hypothetical protein